MAKPTTPDPPNTTNRPAPSPPRPTADEQLQWARANVRNIIIPQLIECGVISCEALYGDEDGEPVVNGLRFRDAANKLVKRRSLPWPFLHAIEGCLNAMLPPRALRENSGYSGVFHVDVDTLAVKIAHEEPFTVTRETVIEFAA